MSATAAEFSFAFPDEPPVLSAGRQLARLLAEGAAISRRSLNEALSTAFGGSDADARWSTGDGHAALELAQVIWLRDHCGLTAPSSGAEASRVFDKLEASLVPQHNRSQAQMMLQQFSTPPRLAWLAARACAINQGELLLEPSAGTGMLAVWAHLAGAGMALNEVDPLRRDCLATLFPKALVSDHDAELIDELLDPRLVPDAVLMNPPYSFGLERGADGRTGSRHLRAAFRGLAPGGRLVAILPEWFDAGQFACKLAAPHALRLNLAIERAFVRHGTSITTRLIVIDKVEADDQVDGLCPTAFRCSSPVAAWHLQAKPMPWRLETASGKRSTRSVPASPTCFSSTAATPKAAIVLLRPGPNAAKFRSCRSRSTGGLARAPGSSATSRCSRSIPATSSHFLAMASTNGW